MSGKNHSRVQWQCCVGISGGWHGEQGEALGYLYSCLEVYLFLDMFGQCSAASLQSSAVLLAVTALPGSTNGSFFPISKRFLHSGTFPLLYWIQGDQR